MDHATWEKTSYHKIRGIKQGVGLYDICDYNYVRNNTYAYI